MVAEGTPIKLAGQGVSNVVAVADGEFVGGAEPPDCVLKRTWRYGRGRFVSHSICQVAQDDFAAGGAIASVAVRVVGFVGGEDVRRQRF